MTNWYELDPGLKHLHEVLGCPFIPENKDEIDIWIETMKNNPDRITLHSIEIFIDFIKLNKPEHLEYVLKRKSELTIAVIDKDLKSDSVIFSILKEAKAKGFGHSNEVKNSLAKRLTYYNKTTLNRMEDSLYKQEKEEGFKEKKEIEDLIEFPEHIKQMGNLFLESEDKFKTIEELLNTEIIGEDKNKVIIWQLLSGSYVKIYSIIVIIGGSGGGKTFLVKRILRFFPKDDLYMITGASDRAIHNKDWDKPKIYIFFINEIQRNLQVVEAIKDFDEEDGGIRYAKSITNEVNDWTTEDKLIPLMNIVATTTKLNLNIELINRAWRLEPDETYKQNKRILDESYDKESNFWKQPNYQEQKDNIKYAIQTIKQEYDFESVKVIYANSLKELLDTKPLKVRRDKDKLLKLIRLSCAWNYRIRSYSEMEDGKVLLAHPNDLKTALFYGKEIFLNIQKGLTPQLINIIEGVNELSKKRGVDWLVVREIHDYLRKKKGYTSQPNTLRKQLNILVDQGKLDMEKVGTKNKYKSEMVKLFTINDVQKTIKEAEREYKSQINEMKKDVKIIEKQITPVEYNFEILTPISEKEEEREMDSDIIEKILGKSSKIQKGVDVY